MIPDMGNNLKKLRNSKSWTLDEAAHRFGLSRGGYIKIERSERGLGDKYIQKAAAVYGVPAHEVFSGPRLADVVGYVGAGGRVAYEAPLDGDLDTVECPTSAPQGTVAVKIRGDSLGSGFDGWYALFALLEDPISRSSTLIGNLCVVGTADGRTLIKWVHLGAKAFTLRSGTGAIEEDVPLMWAAKVVGLTPH